MPMRPCCRPGSAGFKGQVDAASPVCWLEGALEGGGNRAIVWELVAMPTPIGGFAVKVKSDVELPVM